MQLPENKREDRHLIIPWLLPIALPVLLFSILTWIYLAPSGEKTISWKAGENSVLIGRPLPDNRTASCADDRGTCITAIDEPLYMSIVPPAGLWQEMHVSVAYDLHDQEKFELGLMQNFTQQTFTLSPLTSQQESDQWTSGTASFSLDNVQKENGAYKLILSLPGVEDISEKPIIHAVDITFIRTTSVMGEVKWFVKGLWERRL